MAAFLPVPKNIHALACETISRRIERLPFTRRGIRITEGLVGVTLECLNAEVLRTLPLRAVSRGTGTFPGGLAECLRERLGDTPEETAPVISEILLSAGLAEPAEVLDAATHTQIRGVRLLSPWTWHIGSGDVLSGSDPYSGGETDAWLARCPVCKTGILGRVTGKRLFGTPPTDFYLDCSHCGAKFIPEKDRFRLVSIARITDPRWRQYLNSCRKPGEWSTLAGEDTPARPAPLIPTSRYRMALPKKVKTPLPQPPVHRQEKPVRPVEGIPVMFSTLRDGTLVVPGSAKTLYFRPASLRFLRGIRHDLFSHAERTLQEALECPAFAEVKPLFVQGYLHYLPLRLGPVTEELRRKNDPLFRKILNRYGDEDFSSFVMEDEEQARRKGLIIAYVQGKLCHVAGCHAAFADLLDRSFGNITADQCYRDGDETACRINSLVTAFRGTPVIWLHELSDAAAIDAAVADLRGRYLNVPAISP